MHLLESHVVALGVVALLAWLPVAVVLGAGIGRAVRLADFRDAPARRGR